FNDAARIAEESVNKLRQLDEEVTTAIEKMTAGSCAGSRPPRGRGTATADPAPLVACASVRSMEIPRTRRRRRRLPLLWAALPVLILVLFLRSCGGGEAMPDLRPPSDLDGEELRSRIESLKDENERLEAKLRRRLPGETYIVVNTTLNRIYLRKGEETLLDAVCSTGSNTELTTEDGSRRWFFSTPRGVFRVLNRVRRPLWVKPDWAFVEEGEPIPGPRDPERYMRGVLGEYGLYFGNGYLIHGTLFQRFLGNAVTHGCIRVGDDDLERIWEETGIGTRIYIY
ncbi:MAG: L,D-transpeptidase family protein, partial [Candidatus Eisenbacteria bacterium]|nr:L,D-transpeptidase family protein [Candidatus Latescibacterota bacterium]MBD3303464.1 L,D-transpeptidase family protein [Candidatus Eisenbacteria bacterium]